MTDGCREQRRVAVGISAFSVTYLFSPVMQNMNGIILDITLVTASTRRGKDSYDHSHGLIMLPPSCLLATFRVSSSKKEREQSAPSPLGPPKHGPSFERLTSAMVGHSSGFQLIRNHTN